MAIPLTNLKHSATTLLHLSPTGVTYDDHQDKYGKPLQRQDRFEARKRSAFFYSLAGLRAAIRHEDAFRQEVLLAIILVPTALFMPVSAIGKALMIASVLLVLIVESLNSAVEAAVDHTSLDHHQLANAPRTSAAPVLLSLLNVVSVWLLILLN